jgi:hypothetical protein
LKDWWTWSGSNRRPSRQAGTRPSSALQFLSFLESTDATSSSSAAALAVSLPSRSRTAPDTSRSKVRVRAWKPFARDCVLSVEPIRPQHNRCRTFLSFRSAECTRQALKGLVDLVGIEPTTSSMPWKRAPSCATGPLRGRQLYNSYSRLRQGLRSI